LGDDLPGGGVEDRRCGDSLGRAPFATDEDGARGHWAETPNTNAQTPEKIRGSSSGSGSLKAVPFADIAPPSFLHACCLELLWSLDVRAWSFMPAIARPTVSQIHCRSIPRRSLRSSRARQPFA